MKIALKNFLVGIYYQTPTGRAGAVNIRLKAKNSDQAERKARKQFMRGKKGKGYKIHGGDVMEVK